MATTTNTENTKVVRETGSTDTLRNMQSSFEKNQKVIVGAVVALVVLVGGFFGYREYVQKPNYEKASSAIASTASWFNVDSFNYALNGDGQHKGALDVIKKYDGTPAANLAHYYAGVSFLQTGKPQDAIKHLEKFDGKGTVLAYNAYRCLGDAYSETNNAAKAIEMYQKGAQNDKDMFNSPLCLYRAGLLSEQTGKTEEAKKFYKEIKEKYPYSQQGQLADKYLARLGDVSEN